MVPAVMLGESLGNGTMMAWTLSEAYFLQAAGRVVITIWEAVGP